MDQEWKQTSWETFITVKSSPSQDDSGLNEDVELMVQELGSCPQLCAGQHVVQRTNQRVRLSGLKSDLLCGLGQSS